MRRTVVALAVALCALLLIGAPATGQPSPVNYWGQFEGGTGQVSTPTGVAFPGTVVQVASSNSTLYALTSAGTVYAVGNGNNGQLGNGTTTSYTAAPVQVQFPAGVVIASLATDAMPYDAGLALDTDGDVWAWGDDKNDPFCEKSAPILTPVELSLSGVTMIAGAGGHTIFVADGTVETCGYLGSGLGTVESSPTVVTGLPTGTVAGVFASQENDGVLFTDGTYVDWGLNDNGQLGDGTTTNTMVPVAVPLSGVDQVALGGSLTSNGQTLVLLADGSVFTWGSDGNHQLCTSATTDALSPIVVSLSGTIAAVVSNGGDQYLLDTSGDLFACGAKVASGNGKVDQSPTEVETGVVQLSGTANDIVTLS